MSVMRTLAKARDYVLSREFHKKRRTLINAGSHLRRLSER